MRPVLDAFLEAASTISGVEVTPAHLGSGITDVGIDSIDLLEIAMLLENEYAVEIELEEFRELPTLAEAVSSFERLITAAAG